MTGYAAGQVIRLGGNLILTRLLFPEVFGQMALVQIFIQGLAMFSDVGTGPAIVQSARGDDPRFLNTAWTIQCGRGVLLWLASCVIAAPVAAFYGQPLLAWLLPVATLGAVLAGFESTAMHTLQRHMRLGRLTVVELIGQVVGTVGTVGLAALDRWQHGPNNPGAVWAVVGGGLLAGLVRLVLSHTALPGIRHRFMLDPESRTQLFHFGRWIFVSTLLGFLAGQSDRLIFGKLIPLDLFGVYGIAVMLSALPTEAVLKLGGAVVFPAYARLARRDDFRQVFDRVRLPLLLGSGLIVSGMIAAGPYLIRILYDRRYQEAGWILQFLSAVAWFKILECTNGQALLAKGHVRWVAAGSAAKLVGLVAFIPLGFHLGGFPGALAGLVASEALKYATSATGVALCGLPGFARDAAFTLAVALVAWAGLGAGVGAAEALHSTLAGLLGAGLTALAAWAVIAAWTWERGRRALVEAGVTLAALLLLLPGCSARATPAPAAPPAASAPLAASTLAVAPPPLPPSACATEPPRTTGTTSYVCDCQPGAQPGCLAGDDAAAGTRAAPWRSFQKAMARFAAMPGGATVALCQGGSWTGVGTDPETGYLRNHACSAARTCDLRDYPASWGGGGARPRLQLGAGHVFLNLGWYYRYTPEFFTRGLRFLNLELIGNSTDGTVTAENGFKLWGAVTDVELCNLEVHHGVASVLDLVTTSTLARITLRDSSIHDNRGRTICAVCGSADDLTITGNRFDLNGGGNQFSHTVYFYSARDEPQCGNGTAAVAHYCPASRIALRGNVISRSAWGSGGRCMGVAVSAHDVIEGLVVEGNLVTEPAGTPHGGCYGIAFGAGGEAARFTGMVIRGNRVFNVGGNGIAVSGAPGVVIEENLIAGGAPLTTGIAYPEQAATPGVDLLSRDGKVRQNTIYLAAGGGGSWAITGLDEGSGHVIAGNAVVTDRTSRCLKAPAGATVAGNACSTSGAGWWVAPGLDPATADFRPAPGSPLRSEGADAGAPAAGAYQK